MQTMKATDESPSVSVERQRIVVRYCSEIDSTPCEESIGTQDIVQIVLERSEIVDDPIVHWFLKHPEGWTLHFNSQFSGATSAISELQALLKFSLPEVADISGPGAKGTVVWPVT